METAQRFLKTTAIGPGLSFLSIDSKMLSTSGQRDAHTSMLTVAILPIARQLGAKKTLMN